MPGVGDRGVKLVAWLAAVGAVSGALAALLLSRATTPLSGTPWFVFCVVIMYKPVADKRELAPARFVVTVRIIQTEPASGHTDRQFAIDITGDAGLVCEPAPDRASKHSVTETPDDSAPISSRAEDPRIPALRDLITECKMLRRQLPDPKTWTLADPIPKTLYRGLDALDERAAAVLEPGWMEQFRNDPPDLWRYAAGSVRRPGHTRSWRPP